MSGIRTCSIHSPACIVRRSSDYLTFTSATLLDPRNLVKMCIFKCITCTRQRVSMAFQRIGDLPEICVRPAHLFSSTGVDYASSFNIHVTKGCDQKTHKVYCVLFICLTTRVIHLEVADDYTTDRFLAAFDRFSASRGVLAVILSDNETNFQNADRGLSRRIRAITSDSHLQYRFASEEISWRFISAAASHFGGL